jgi:putative spermidine/putrescine transport system permease protein
MKRGFASEGLSPFQRFYLAFLALAVVGPILPMVVASFAFRWAWPDLLPEEWWIDARAAATSPIGWDYVFSSYSRLFEATFNTLLLGGLVTLVCVAISLPAARVLARDRFRGKSAVEFFLLTPLIVPDVAVGLGILLIFIQLGLAGTYPGLILAHLIPTLPYAIRVLTSVFQGLSTDYEEQSRVLGASPLKTLWYVTLPMIFPGVVAAGLFVFLVSSNIFLLTFFVSRGQVETLPTLLFSRISSGGVLDPVAAGITLITMVPGIVLLIITERFIRDEVFAKGFGG